jgi:hypothetical protein
MAAQLMVEEAGRQWRDGVDDQEDASLAVLL